MNPTRKSHPETGSIIVGLALLAGFNGWLLWFTIDLGIASSIPWWTIATVGALAGLGILVWRRDAWPLALAVALGATAVMRLNFAFATLGMGLAPMVALLLAVAFVVATVSAVRRQAALRWALAASVVLVLVLMLEQAVDARWDPFLRQIPHIIALSLLAWTMRPSALEGAVGPETQDAGPV